MTGIGIGFSSRPTEFEEPAMVLLRRLLSWRFQILVTSLGQTYWAYFCRLRKRVLETADIGQRRAQVGDYAGTTSLLDAVWCAVGRCVVRCLTRNSEQSESPYLPKSECPTMDAASAASMGGHTEVGMRACDFVLLKAGCRFGGSRCFFGGSEKRCCFGGSRWAASWF